MTAPRFPRNATIYEAVRTHPEASARLSAIGLTPDYYDYRMDDAARAIGLPLERLQALLSARVQRELVEA